ncbi:MAG: M10 family metallopeptidase C-terminal domain-containing protein [Hyphomicrobiales bacterium]|nr:M10 family metallopeptidase C-terminal domain-containing protein [Hyphomicrobiales bacterium]
MPKPVFTPQQIADQLTRSGLHWTGTTITYSFPTSGSTSTSYSVDATQKAWIREAIQLVGDALGLTFVEVAPGASSNIKFVNDTGGGTYASTSYFSSSRAIASSTIYLDQSWSSNQSANLDYGSYGFLTILHEFLHALGLSHPGDYNAGSGGPITYANSAEFEQDTHRYSVMSYFAAYEDGSGTSHFFWTGSSWQWVYPQSPMVYDLLALTEGNFAGYFNGYAENSSTRSGNTVYGYNSTANREIFDFTINNAPVLTIFDSGGIDTLDLSGDTASRALEPVYDSSGQLIGWQNISSTYTRVIDLHEGAYSSTHGMSNNLAIAFGTVIENAIGTSFDDIIYGNDYANILNGGAGDDILYGGGGGDTFLYQASSDWGDDTIKDFEPDVDLVKFEGVAPASIHYTQVGNDVLITVDGFSGSVLVENTLVEELDPTNPGAQFNIAELQTFQLNHQTKTITLSNTYENPVVIARVVTNNGGEPVTVRITNVTSNSITLRLQEPNFNDGWHMWETVSLMVVEAGSWIMEDGTLLQAGTINSSKLSPQGLESVTFGQSFGATPSVFTQVQTLNGPDYVATRQGNATTDGFLVTMQEEEARNNSGHVIETIGWVAIERGSGTWNGIAYEAGATAKTVTNAFQSVSFGTAFSGAPIVVPGLSSLYGTDPAVQRTQGISASGFQVRVQEDQSQDAEIWHLAEVFDYFAVSGTGTLTGSSAAAVMAQAGTSLPTGQLVTDPAVLAQLSSLNGSEGTVTQIGDPRLDSFAMWPQEPHLNGEIRVIEMNGAQATVPGTGVGNGNLFEAVNTGTVVTSNLAAETLEQSFMSAPLASGNLATRDDGDPVGPGYGNGTPAGVQDQAGTNHGPDTEFADIAEALDDLAVDNLSFVEAGLLSADHFAMV